MINKTNYRPPTTRQAHWLAYLHLVGVAPEFTLSMGDCKYSRKPPNVLSFYH